MSDSATPAGVGQFYRMLSGGGPAGAGSTSGYNLPTLRVGLAVLPNGCVNWAISRLLRAQIISTAFKASLVAGCNVGLHHLGWVDDAVELLFGDEAEFQGGFF